MKYEVRNMKKEDARSKKDRMKITKYKVESMEKKFEMENIQHV
jgi:hypothetical protein